MKMTRQRQEFIFSFPVMFMWMLVLMAALQFPIYGFFSIINFVILNIPMAAFFTFSTRKRMRLDKDKTGFINPDKQWALQNAVRTGVIPDDSQILTKASDYLEWRQSENEKTQKNFWFFVILLLTVAGFMAYSNAMPGIIFGVLLLAILTFDYRLMKKIEKNIEVLRRQSQQ